MLQEGLRPEGTLDDKGFTGAVKPLTLPYSHASFMEVQQELYPMSKQSLVSKTTHFTNEKLLLSLRLNSKPPDMDFDNDIGRAK